jgi:trimeric autotransporter adhesin
LNSWITVWVMIGEKQGRIVMKMLTPQTRLVSLLGLLVFLWSTAYAQVTPLGDSYTNTADPAKNFGAGAVLHVGATEVTYIQLNLESIPATASVSQATLKLYVNTVSTPGSFDVDYVDGAWAENTIDASNAPPLGAAIASHVSITAADTNQYILVNVTTAVAAWLSGSETNNGIALVANGSFSASFDSKENAGTSHPAELDIAYAGGDGTITGVTTAAGSGLAGGGTSGTLNLSLTNVCAANQILQWNGSSWVCATAGTGTVTSVAAGTGLTASPSPITGSGSLSINTAVVPQLGAANTFTGNQTVNGNLSATGVVTGSSYQIGSNLFAFGSSANENAFLGFAGNTTTTGIGNTASGNQALYSNTTGGFNTASGEAALKSNTTGYYNTATGTGALFSNTTGYQNAATGQDALYANTTGYGNTASGYSALGFNSGASYNTAYGYEALFSNVGDSGGDGWYNTAVGYAALYWNNTSGSGNYASYEVAVGAKALFSNTTGNANTAVGGAALFSNTTGFFNTAVGDAALQGNTTASYNTAVGNQALANNASGYDNAAVGFTALYNNSSGYSNTAVGWSALSLNTTGSDLTCVGYDCDNAADGLSNATAIGAHARVGASNSLVLGGTGQYAVKVGIGTTTPSNVLTVAQGAGHPVSDSWETYSSRRWKTNIQPIDNALAKVEKLRGVSYDLKETGKHEIGVIAEEVGAVVPELVSYEANGTDARSVDYARLTALLIEATKEQQREIQRQQSQINDLRSELRQTRQSLQKIEARMSSTQPAVVAEKVLWVAGGK